MHYGDFLKKILKNAPVVHLVSIYYANKWKKRHTTGVSVGFLFKNAVSTYDVTYASELGLID